MIAIGGTGMTGREIVKALKSGATGTRSRLTTKRGRVDILP
ncbi:MAG: hypothetical protein ACE5Q3_00650 [Alphaproteobacteria bacterium]